MEKIRETIDYIDNHILVLLKERFEQVKKIKDIKIQNKISILDLDRETYIYDNIYKLYPEYYVYFKPIYKVIIKESKSNKKIISL